MSSIQPCIILLFVIVVLCTATNKYHHGKSEEYFNLIHNKPASSLKDRFLEQYNKVITNGKMNGYFSPDGVPYYSVETMLVDEYGYVDYGHESTAEVFSAYIWITAMNIWATNTTIDFKTAWSKLETYLIPSQQAQPGCNNYNPSSPSIYCPVGQTSAAYPVRCDPTVQVGDDILNTELADIYGSDGNINQIYIPHWLLDVDNIYGFGQKESGNAADRNVYINSFQAGPSESVWRTLVTPSRDAFKYGGKCGFADYFEINPPYSCEEQWNYRGAPDASTTIIQATYWAYNFSNEGVAAQVNNAVKLSDFTRYALFDKYFKNVPCYSTNCPTGTWQNGWNTTFYLIGWYMAWTGGLQQNWSFRTAAWDLHQQHQNVFSAYILSTIPAFQSKTSGGKEQWEGVRYKTIDFWEWLQSTEGAIAGGATNSWNGDYSNPAQDGVTGYFEGMPYLMDPAEFSPPSNNWFGYQTISQERNAEYCYLSGDGRACQIVKKWVNWIMSINSSILLPNNDYQIPSNISWSGQPINYTGTPHTNPDLHVIIHDYDKNVGSASVLAHTLTYYAASSGDSNVQILARELLDRIFMYADMIGIGVNETRQDYIGNMEGNGFWEQAEITCVDCGIYPDGDKIERGATFLSVRSWYKNDPSWPIVEHSKMNGIAPVFVYHRFWSQCQYAIACADYARLFTE